MFEHLDSVLSGSGVDRLLKGFLICVFLSCVIKGFLMSPERDDI